MRGWELAPGDPTEGSGRPELARRLDFAAMEQLAANWTRPAGGADPRPGAQRYADAVWRIRYASGARTLVLLLEFQSTVDAPPGSDAHLEAKLRFELIDGDPQNVRITGADLRVVWERTDVKTRAVSMEVAGDARD